MYPPRRWAVDCFVNVGLSSATRGGILLRKIDWLPFYITLQKINTVASLPHVDFLSLGFRWKTDARKNQDGRFAPSSWFFARPSVALADKLLATLFDCCRSVAPVAEQLIVLLTQDWTRRRARGKFASRILIVLFTGGSIQGGGRAPSLDPPRKTACGAGVSTGDVWYVGRRSLGYSIQGGAEPPPWTLPAGVRVGWLLAKARPSFRQLIVLLTQGRAETRVGENLLRKFYSKFITYYIALQKINTVASLPHVDFLSLCWSIAIECIAPVAGQLIVLLTQDWAQRRVRGFSPSAKIVCCYTT